MNLFATWLNHELPWFVSPYPDPRAWKVDAFSFEWKDMVAYAFPSPKLLHKVSRKLRQSPVRLYWMAPCWPNQSWFPDLFQLLFDLPLKTAP